ncbi:MAG: cryptochrome/photolyase family protein [Alphaproteobacteria bacterium]|nr:cryptochrome/photolyase family protein [Alphaproteobacteria bacterium]
MTRAFEDKARHLVLVLGDQLNAETAAFQDFDKEADAVLMLEVAKEASYIPQHKIRLALFFSGMRHFCQAIRDKGYTVHYVPLEDANNRGSFAEEIGRWCHKTRPDKLIVTKPGDHRVEAAIVKAERSLDCKLEIRADRHFIGTLEDFDEFADARKTLILETFYRRMRRRHDILMDGDKPVGGEWNFDKDNRESFGADGPGDIKAPRSFQTDDTTNEVIEMVEEHFSDSPGRLDAFDYPVARSQARAALRDFIEHRLPNFGTYQDAMVTDQPYLYHSRLSCVLNLHLLDPREAIDAAIAAYEAGDAPINAVEGFVRQILGWREFVRGVYWREMPDYADLNALDADLPMPAFMWTGETEMNCVKQSVGQLIDHAYAHHIQRLMVLGLFALLLGVRPYDVHRWHMSMYADAIDWVSLPNVLGMSQYADGGLVGSKPYAASGNYINKMSDYCADCRYNPKNATGEEACPFTTLYWDFLSRNRQRLRGNRRMGLQFNNLDRKDDSERRAIRNRADSLKSDLTADTYL